MATTIMSSIRVKPRDRCEMGMALRAWKVTDLFSNIRTTGQRRQWLAGKV
ncbi:hypothetical protein KPL74_11650 [Bacillus sp. NP157]|nr:hypothetical protein KPL74_11650 [Bacillus sp. NP157]